MKIKKIEDIIAWQKAQDYAVEIYPTFITQKDYGFKDQICRASVSISNKIAEGFDSSGKAEFRRFLYISFGSCSETKSMLYLAERIKDITYDQKNALLSKGNEISKIIRGLIKSIDN